MRIKLNCISCGHLMELGAAYEDYQGELRCWGCHALVEVTLHEGKLQTMKLSSKSEVPDLALKN
jgi:hypothetical protein